MNAMWSTLWSYFVHYHLSWKLSVPKRASTLSGRLRGLPLCVIIRCDLQRSFSLGSAIAFVYWIASCSQSLKNVYYKYGEFIVMIRLRISYQSLGSSHIIGTDQSTLGKDSSDNLISYDPSDLGSLIPFRIICPRNALLKLPLPGSQFGGFLWVCRSFPRPD